MGPQRACVPVASPWGGLWSGAATRWRVNEHRTSKNRDATASKCPVPDSIPHTNRFVCTVYRKRVTLPIHKLKIVGCYRECLREKQH